MIKRFTALIFPTMAMSYGDAKRVCDAKGIWMVEYLRARRNPQWGGSLSHIRKQYFKDKTIKHSKERDNDISE